MESPIGSLSVGRKLELSHISVLMQTANLVEKDGNMGMIEILRRVTTTVKTFPFFYAAGLILFWLTAPMLNTTLVVEIDGLILLSAVMVLFLIRLSYCVKLCIWHRLQCALPLLPQASAYFDEQIYEFGAYTATANTIAMILVFTLSLVNAYFVFVKPSVRHG